MNNTLKQHQTTSADCAMGRSHIEIVFNYLNIHYIWSDKVPRYFNTKIWLDDSRNRFLLH